MLNVPSKFWKGVVAALVTGVSAYLAQSTAIHLSPEVQATIIAALVGSAIEVPSSRQ